MTDTLSGTELRQARARLERVVSLLDDQFRVPGTPFRFGWDALIGLVPVAGDVAGFALSAWVISEAIRLGAPRATVQTMVRNVAIEALVGIIPILGDLFDVAWKANRRNLDLLQRHLDGAQRVKLEAAVSPRGPMNYVKAFVAGFLSTLLFHQGMLALLHALNPAAPAPFRMAATAPFGVPAVISLAFWGGLWGMALWLVIRARTGAAYWSWATIIGAVAPSAVALLLVMPLKGMAVAGGGDPKVIVGALLLNGAWGIGVALLMRLLQRF
jgi:hypothetical protein